MKYWLINHKVEIGSILGITISASLLLFMPGITLGHDLLFHLLRIAGISDELAQGHFPVRLQSVWMDGYGYPVSIYYGDLLLYFPAVLHLLGLKLTDAYELYLLFINFATALVSFICFKRIFKNRDFGLILSLVYTTAPYRLVDVFVRSAVGEYTAFLFFPLIALAFYEMYFDAEDNILKNSIILAFGMTGLIITHILSTEMCALILGITCLFFLKKTFSKKVFISLTVSVFLTLLLSAFFIVPFTDYFLHVPVNVRDITRYWLQPGGVFISQLFAFFQNPFGGDSFEVSGRMLYSPGLALMTGYVFSIVYLVYYKRDRQLSVLLCFATFIILLSSNLFPWDKISLIQIWKIKIGRILSQIQFACRWLGIVFLFLTLLLGRLLVLSEKELFKTAFMYKIMLIVIISLTLFQTFCFTSQYIDRAENYEAKNYKKFGSELIANPEYIRQGSDEKNRSGKIVEKDVIVTDLLRNRNNFSFHAVTVYGGFVELPLFNYKGYKAIASDETEISITDGENNVVRLNIPAMFDGNIEVSFVEPLYWRIAELVSLISFLIVLFFIFKKHTA